MQQCLAGHLASPVLCSVISNHHGLTIACVQYVLTEDLCTRYQYL